MPKVSKDAIRTLIWQGNKGNNHRDGSRVGAKWLNNLAAANGLVADLYPKGGYGNIQEFDSLDLSQYDVIVFISTIKQALTATGMEKIEEYMRNGGNWAGFYGAGAVWGDNPNAYKAWPFYSEVMMSGAGAPKGKNSSAGTLTVRLPDNPVGKDLMDHFGNATFRQGAVYYGWEVTPDPIYSIVWMDNGPVSGGGVNTSDKPAVFGSDTEWGGRTFYSPYAPPAVNGDWVKNHVVTALQWVTKAE